jgi:phosphodiesterase/alkaline phosphatase D-like protein
MIFDDHEIIDDWNTSDSWRADQQRQSWWSERIAAGLASYWVYQHLGNLSPDELADDPVYRAVRAGDDATAALADFGARADGARGAYRWSYALDIGRTRLVVLDNRAGRELRPGHRVMLPEEQWNWLVGAVRDGDYDHLVIGSSLPWLLAPAFHHIEAMNERLGDSDRPWVAGAAEWVRRTLDLEHWAAFGRSFDALGLLVGQLGSGPDAPATISVLSGDVHHSYAARARLGDEVTSRVHQLTCSPIHNGLPRLLQAATRLGWTRGADRAARGLARLAGTPAPGVTWELACGPHFGNAVSTLIHQGRAASVVVEGTDPRDRLRRLGAVRLSAE